MEDLMEKKLKPLLVMTGMLPTEFHPRNLSSYDNLILFLPFLFSTSPHRKSDLVCQLAKCNTGNLSFSWFGGPGITFIHSFTAELELTRFYLNI